MVKFLTRRGTASLVEEIIKKAEKELVLISPYLQISDDLYARLRDADKKNYKMKFVCRDEERNADQQKKIEREIQRLQSLKNLSITHLKNLHAKCYYNEDCMVVTSMNLYDYSERNNWEMGILIHREHDEETFKEVKEEAESIIKSATPVKLRSSVFEKAGKRLGKGMRSVIVLAIKDEPQKPTSKTRTTSRTKKEGYCIRCKTSIPYNLDSPYCRDCWKKWKEGGENPDYIERHGSCHTCGRPAPTSKARPQCISCYKPRR